MASCPIHQNTDHHGTTAAENIILKTLKLVIFLRNRKPALDLTKHQVAAGSAAERTTKFETITV